MNFFPQLQIYRQRFRQLPVLILCLLLLSTPGRAELVDKVVAVVNDEIITLSEVEEEAARAYQSLAKEYSGKKLADSLAEAKAEILDSMIDRRLINQKAKQTNMTVSEEEITNAYENTRKRNALDPEQFKEKLAASGLTEEAYRRQLKDQILQGKLVSQDVRSKVVVTEEMLKEYFDEHYSAQKEKGSYYLLQMGFTWNTDIDQEEQAVAREEARKRAQRVLDQIRDGADFKALAKEHSDLPSASDGGDIGIMSLDDMAPSMKNAISLLKPGELTDIIETPTGFQFYKVLSGEEKEKASSASFDAVKEEIREKLYDEKMKAAYIDWVKKLKEDAFIRKL